MKINSNISSVKNDDYLECWHIKNGSDLMKCLNCGRKNTSYLCNNCRTPEVLEKIFNYIRFYKPDECENQYLVEYASGLTEKYEERDIIPEILSYFDLDVAEFFYCQYYRMSRDERFEDSAITYIKKHQVTEMRTQRIIYDLMDYYIPNDFVNPKKWCEIIEKSDDLCMELYGITAKFYGMIGEYEKADEIADKALELCENVSDDRYIYSNHENMVAKLEKQKVDTERYRTKKPYWPTTEERRRAVAMFYDDKGIKYPRIESKPKKIKECDFAPVLECYDEKLDSYCAFWCAEVFSIVAVKDIYAIAAVKVKDGNVIDSFESFIRPCNGENSRKFAAKEANVNLETIENAEDVDLVIPKFFDFVSDDVLVSTGALGNQAKLLSRAARYSGMKEIKNEFYEILDLAADTADEFDLANNNREFLLSYFSIAEGETPLEKAKVNVELYNKLINYGE